MLYEDSKDKEHFGRCFCTDKTDITNGKCPERTTRPQFWRTYPNALASHKRLSACCDYREVDIVAPKEEVKRCYDADQLSEAESVEHGR